MANGRGIAKFLPKFMESWLVVWKITEKTMHTDDEMIGERVQCQLSTHGHHLSKNTILWSTTALGWMAPFLE